MRISDWSSDVCSSDLADRQVREDLAVELDAGELQAVHEHRVGHAVLPHAGVDALDPQRAEVALAVAAVTVGVLQALLDRLHGEPEDVLAAAGIARRLVDALLVAGIQRPHPLSA